MAGKKENGTCIVFGPNRPTEGGARAYVISRIFGNKNLTPN